MAHQNLTIDVRVARWVWPCLHALLLFRRATGADISAPVQWILDRGVTAKAGKHSA